MDPVALAIAAAVRRIAAARAALEATGETTTPATHGRAPSRSDTYRRAREEIHAAEQARNRLFANLVGDHEAASHDLARRLGLTGREAAHVIQTARAGTPRMRANVFGEKWSPGDDARPERPLN